jgi:O-antigen ligase
MVSEGTGSFHDQVQWRMWSEALTDIAQRPLFGHGEGAIPLESRHRRYISSTRTVQCCGSCSMGIVGTLAVLMFANTLHKARRKIRKLL